MASDWKEARRMRAYELRQQSWKQRDIAAALGVSEAAVSQWMSMAETAGVSGLHARPRPGAPRRLSDEQLWMLPDCLSHGAEAYGFRGEVWTCARVGKVIEWEFGVVYDRSQVSRLLKQVAWTPQKPIERASQRDEVQIAHWRMAVWRELKKRLGWSAECLFVWMNRGSTCCPVACARMRRVDARPSCGYFKPTIICRS